MSFAPGPYHVVVIENKIFVHSSVADGMYPILGVPVPLGNFRQTFEQAALFAAAPTLLDSVYALLGCLDGLDLGACGLENARVIQKRINEAHAILNKIQLAANAPEVAS